VTMLTCDVGASIVVTGTLKDAAGTNVVGATVTVKVIKGDGTQQTLGEATDNGDGTYSLDVDLDISGTWAFRFESATPDKAASEGIIWVRETRFV